MAIAADVVLDEGVTIFHRDQEWQGQLLSVEAVDA